MTIEQIKKEKELKHFGILGMRWGKRKASGPASQDHTTSRELRKKQTHELSNDEIRKITTRLQLEKQLKDLDDKKSNRSKEMVGKFLNSPIGKIALGLLYKKIKSVFDKRTGYSSPDDVPGDIIDAVLLEDHN